MFAAVKKEDAENSNFIDGTWVRKWKKVVQAGKSVWIVKSKFCGRGFLAQQYEIQKHSSTASRISQRIAVSCAANEGWELESWGIANAFLQGLIFKELHS